MVIWFNWKTSSEQLYLQHLIELSGLPQSLPRYHLQWGQKPVSALALHYSLICRENTLPLSKWWNGSWSKRAAYFTFCLFRTFCLALNPAHIGACCPYSRFCHVCVLYIYPFSLLKLYTLLSTLSSGYSCLSWLISFWLVSQDGSWGQKSIVRTCDFTEIA